jgi:hypothetical protein
MDVKDVVARCCQRTGLKLKERIEVLGGVRCLTIGDPSHGSKYDLTLSVGVGGRHLREVYGRMRHWGITREEQDVLLHFLSPTPVVAQEVPPPNPFDIDSLNCG